MGQKFEIDADFSDQDMDVIIEAVEDWETRDMELLTLIDKLRLIPDPPDDPENPEYREHFLEFKKHMLGQESKAKETRKMRRERATMLKAKIILMKQARTAEKLMEEARNS